MRKLTLWPLLMKMRVVFLGFAVASLGLVAAAAADDAARKGMTIRVRTKTCIAFDLQEIFGRDGAPSTWVLAGVVVIPTADSRMGVLVDSWLVGAKVTGFTVTKKGWNLDLVAADLAITPKGAVKPLVAGGLAYALQAQVQRAIEQAIAKGTVPPGTVAPVVAPEGLSSGTAWVTYAGSDATPVTPDTQEQRALEDAKAAEQAKAGGKP